VIRFLLAEIYLNLLNDKMTPNDVRHGLEVFLRQDRGENEDQKVHVLSLAYAKAMRKIGEQNTEPRKLAMQVLSWITHAKRPLSTLEIRHAIATRENSKELSQGDLPHISDIISVCGGLVTVDKESDIVRLVHYTTQKYLETLKDGWFGNPEDNITSTCITYLSFRSFQEGPSKTDLAFEERLKSNSLYDYASRHWAHHARNRSALLDRVVQFLGNASAIGATSQVLLASKVYAHNSPYKWDSQIIPRNIRGVHLAAFFGLDEALLRLIAGGANPRLKDTWDRTPLWYAANNGHAEIIDILLRQPGVEPDLKDTFQRTPLLWAAENGHEAVVRRLLADERVERNFREPYLGQTALWKASNKGLAGMVKLLLENGLDPRSADKEGQNPFQVAISRGQWDVAKIFLDGRVASVDAFWETVARQKVMVTKKLIDSGIDLNARLFGSETPLSWAIRSGKEAIARLLIESGNVDINFKYEGALSALSLAAREGKHDLVKLLLDRGADLTAVDHGLTALSWALKGGNKYTAKAILKFGAELNFKNRQYRNEQLIAAVRYCDMSIVNRLLGKGIDIICRDKDGRTPLFWAESRGNEPMIQALLEIGTAAQFKDVEYDKEQLSVAIKYGNVVAVKGVIAKGTNLEQRDAAGRTPLLWAVKNEQTKIVKVLVEEGATIESKDQDGMSALHWAAHNRNEEVLDLILEAGTKMQFVDPNFDNEQLTIAASFDRADIVKKLLEKGAKLWYRDLSGRTPLSHATEKHCKTAIRVLLEAGHKTESHDLEYNNEQLFVAVWSGQVSVANHLLQKGASVHTKGSDGRTLLSVAAEQGNEELLTLLLQYGINIEESDEKGLTALHWASDQANEKVVQLLLEKGASLNPKDKRELTPIFYAARAGSQAIVNLLLMRGADIESKNRNVQTVLSLVAEIGDEEMTDLLLHHGANADARDKYGCVPIFWAIRSEHNRLATLLLKWGNDVESKDNGGASLLAYAAVRGNLPVVEELVSKGALLETRDGCLRTPLIHAAANGRDKIVQFLLASGADTDPTDYDGLSALHHASRFGFVNVVSILLKGGANTKLLDNHGISAESWAKHRGHDAVTQLFIANEKEEIIRANGSLLERFIDEQLIGTLDRKYAI
jgi:ankyrin repeat protein